MKSGSPAHRSFLDYALLHPGYTTSFPFPCSRDSPHTIRVRINLGSYPAAGETPGNFLFHATPQRLLREFAEFTEAVTAERPLVLILEDLQWSDPSTVDLLGYLAQRRETARFLIIGAYRPGDLLSGEHLLQFLL